MRTADEWPYVSLREAIAAGALANEDTFIAAAQAETERAKAEGLP